MTAVTASVPEIDREYLEPPADTMPERLMWLESLIHGIHNACKEGKSELGWLLRDDFFIGSYTFHCETVGICPFALRLQILMSLDKIAKKRNLRIGEIVRGINYGQYQVRGKYKKAA